MRIEPEIDTVAVVLLGRLNPAIFQPQWFARCGLVSDEDAEAAHIEIIHPEISKFQIGKFEISVETGRLVAELQSPPFVEVVDFLERTFREFLPHTRIYQMGINRSVHFSVGTEEARNEIGMRLAPHEPWGNWGEAIERPFPNRGGLRILTMEERGLEDRPNGHFQVRVEPSLKVKGDVGIYVSTNDDYRVADAEDVDGCREILDLLHSSFEPSMKRAETIIDQLMSLKP